MLKNPAVARVRRQPTGATIHGGFTELKAAAFDTLDCGAEKNQWNETIVQLCVPEEAEKGGVLLTAAKFLSILTRSHG